MFDKGKPGRLGRLAIALAMVLTAVFGTSVVHAPHASADPAGNYAQGNYNFACGVDSIGGGADVRGYVDVHFTHYSDHSDKPYGTYVTITSKSGYVAQAMYIDTDVKYYGQSTWHYQDTSIINGTGSFGWIFTYPASATLNGGYSRWALTYYTGASNMPHTCHIPDQATGYTWGNGWPYNKP